MLENEEPGVGRESATSNNLANQRLFWLNHSMTPVGALLKGMLAVVAGGLYIVPLLLSFSATAATPGVSLIIQDNTTKPVQHGLSKLTKALQTKGIEVQAMESFSKATINNVIVAGFSSGNGPTATLIAEMSLTPPKPRIPSEDVVTTWDRMYFIEVMEQHGTGGIYPDLNHETPYIIVKLQR